MSIHHNHTPQQHKQGEPNAGTQPFEKHVAWDLLKRAQNLVNLPKEKEMYFKERVGEVKYR